MCGIAGFISPGSHVEDSLAIARRMTDVIGHRGPDSDGYWASDDGAAVFGHARLAIQDLSAHGSQPMHSASRRYVICYNGEVYNFPELITELKARGHAFRGHSDTEVILAAIDEWGLEAAVNRFIGMFAFALWDDESRLLHLVRDRLGIKPLYYSCLHDGLIFGSELKSIRASNKASLTLDRRALALFLRHNYVPTPYTIYENVNKLPPGQILTASVDGNGTLTTKTRPYWSIESIACDEQRRFVGSYEDATEHLHDLLLDAVQIRKVSDVPLGAFLSGGIDSSTVVSLLQSTSSMPVRTFTIGFGETSHNEAHWAQQVAEHLGTEHKTLYLQPHDVQAVVPDLASIFDEPFSDSSQIPTLLISRLAREDVIVSLSGDGGDELFAGYKRYDAAVATWRSIAWMPATIRKGLGGMLAPMSSAMSRIVDPLFGKIYDSFGVQGNRGNELQRAAAVLQLESREALYHFLMSHWKNSTDVVRSADGEYSTLLSQPPEWMRQFGFRDYMMLLDAQTYLHDDILTKVDRASMSCSLEARVPILDHRVVEFAVQMPLAFKRHGGKTKAPLRDILRRYLPAELVDRPKMGFAIPIDDWLRGPLREWAGDLLASESIERQGYLNAGLIDEKWREHQSGSRNWAGYLWDVLMFQAWLAAAGKA